MPSALLTVIFWPWMNSPNPFHADYASAKSSTFRRSAAGDTASLQANVTAGTQGCLAYICKFFCYHLLQGQLQSPFYGRRSSVFTASHFVRERYIPGDLVVMLLRWKWQRFRPEKPFTRYALSQATPASLMRRLLNKANWQPLTACWNVSVIPLSRTCFIAVALILICSIRFN